MPDAPDTTGRLTADQAAEVARRHGLTLSDAAAIHALADNEADADRIAARFSPDNTPEALADAVYRAQGRTV